MVNIYSSVIYYLSFFGLFATIFYTINLYSYYKKYNYQEAEDKTVSVIIPAYNEEESIEKTIKSALSLNYQKDKIEIMIIDDGSKDKTYEIAKRFSSRKDPKVKVLTKSNGGKGSALNFGIKHSKAEIIVTMDADTFAEKDSLRKMVGYFYNKDITAVTPSMGVYKPKNIWQKIQQIEYAMGVFLRKSFSTINAIHVTPGAFSAYRRDFFETFGGYDEKNITEDLEIALRIQSKNLKIENASKAIAYTIAPNSFKTLLIQRRRWYSGLIKNLWSYKSLFGPRKGSLGILVLPMAIITIIFPTALTTYLITQRIIKIKNDLSYLSSINYKFNNILDLNYYIIENYLFNLFSQPIFLLTILFCTIIILYIYFSKKNNLKLDGIKINFFLFIMCYSILLAIWWIISFIYILTNKKISWR